MILKDTKILDIFSVKKDVELKLQKEEEAAKRKEEAAKEEEAKRLKCVNEAANTIYLALKPMEQVGWVICLATHIAVAKNRLKKDRCGDCKKHDEVKVIQLSHPNHSNFIEIDFSFEDYDRDDYDEYSYSLNELTVWAGDGSSSVGNSHIRRSRLKHLQTGVNDLLKYVIEYIVRNKLPFPQEE